MPIYHLSIKTISRSAGHSAIAAAAYRAGVAITDERTGECHNYNRRSGVEKTVLLLPNNSPEWAMDRAALWNAAEAAEKRKNSTVAREFEIALPSELNANQRTLLTYNFAHALVKRHGCAADVAIHAPGKEGDERNYHAHILLTTRRLGADGFTEKTRELDDQKSGEILRWREYFSELQNKYLRSAGISEKVDHRTLEEQGIDRIPTQHLGPTATAIERRTKQPSHKRLNQLRERKEQLENVKEEKKLAKEYKETEKIIVNLSNKLQTAKLEHQEHTIIEEGLQDIWTAFDKNEKEQAAAAERLAKKKELELKRKTEEWQRREEQEMTGELPLIGSMNEDVERRWQQISSLETCIEQNKQPIIVAESAKKEEDIFLISIYYERNQPGNSSDRGITIEREFVNADNLKKYSNYYKITEPSSTDPRITPYIWFKSTSSNESYSLHVHEVNGSEPEAEDYQKIANLIGARFDCPIEFDNSEQKIKSPENDTLTF